MPEPDRHNFDIHFAEVPLRPIVLNALLWGTLAGGMAFMIVFHIARLLLLEPIFAIINLPHGRELSMIAFSFAFICSAAYAVYAVSEELKRREECKQRGLKPWKS